MNGSNAKKISISYIFKPKKGSSGEVRECGSCRGSGIHGRCNGQGCMGCWYTGKCPGCNGKGCH